MTTLSYLNTKSIATAAAVVALACFGAAAQAEVILSNYSSANITVGSNFPTANAVKAVGFSMLAGTDYTLDSVKLRLAISANADPLVELYSDNGSGSFGSLLTELVDPTFAYDDTNHDYVFSPNGAFTLSGGTSYWLVVHNSGTGNFGWRANNPSIVPSGSPSTLLGYRFGNTGLTGTSSSTTRNSVEISGTAISSVPEPTTALLMIGGLLVAGGAARRKAQRVA